MNQPKPLISVIIPVYNVADYLVPCLESACGQTYTNLEIIVINDGSKDGSCKIIQRFAKRDPRIVVIDKQNEGLTFGRRDGIMKSTGEYVFWVDGDDYVSLDCIEKLYDAISETGSEVASAQRVRVRDKYISADRFMPPGKRNNREFLNILLLHRHVTVGGKLYKRNLWPELNYYKEIGLGEDFVFNIQVAVSEEAPSIVFVDNAFYFYVQRPESMIRGKDNFDYLENFMNRVAGETRKLSDRNDKGLSEEIIAERALRFYVHIKRERNEWQGDRALAVSVREEVKQNERMLRGLIPGIVIYSIKLYGRRGNKCLIILMSLFSRLRLSARRRKISFSLSGVALPPSVKHLKLNRNVRIQNKRIS